MMSHREQVQQDLDEADRRVRAGDVAGARKATRRAVDRVSGPLRPQDGAMVLARGRARAQRRDAAVRASGGMALKAVRRAAKRISAASKKAWSRAKREFSGGV